MLDLDTILSSGSARKAKILLWGWSQQAERGHLHCCCQPPPGCPALHVRADSALQARQGTSVPVWHCTVKYQGNSTAACTLLFLKSASNLLSALRPWMKQPRWVHCPRAAGAGCPLSAESTKSPEDVGGTGEQTGDASHCPGNFQSSKFGNSVQQLWSSEEALPCKGLIPA